MQVLVNTQACQTSPDGVSVSGFSSTPKVDVPPVYYLGMFNTSDDCLQAANASKKRMYTWTWHHNDFDPVWASQCYGRADKQFEPKTQSKVSSGSRVGDSAIQYTFSAGGFQGGEGVTDGENWYIENVLEELDMGREWYYAEETSTLYYKPNTTANDAAPSGSFSATNLKVLFNITGSKEKPAQGQTITGLTLRDTAYTYMDPHGLPSGG